MDILASGTMDNSWGIYSTFPSILWEFLHLLYWNSCTPCFKPNFCSLNQCWSGQGKYLPRICWKQHIFTTKALISWILPKNITNFCNFLGKHMYMYHVYSQNILHIYGIQKNLKDPPKSGLHNNFSYTRFCACKTILGACPCMWEIMPVKEQTYMSLIITWYGGRKCTKLVLKPLAAKSDLSFSVLCTTPFL